MRVLKSIQKTAPALGVLALIGCGPKAEEKTVVVENTPPDVTLNVKSDATKEPTAEATGEATKEPTKAPEKTATKAPTKAPAKAAPVKVGKLGPIPKDATKLIKEEIKLGIGATAKPGDLVTVHYTGTLTDGKKFDSSLDRDQPFIFTLGNREVIQGWDEGVAGMKSGGKRRLIIPAALAYGDNPPTPDIPPGATLVFTVELLNVGSLKKGY